MDVEPLSEHGGCVVTGSGDIRSLPVPEVAGAFKRYGAIVFHGFTLDTDTFRDFTHGFTTRFVTYSKSGRKVVADDPTTQTVNVGNGRIPFHQEFSFIPFRPTALWFYCVRPAAAGGETILADGVRLAQRVAKNPVCGTLADRRVRYKLDIPQENWAPFIESLVGISDADRLQEWLRDHSYGEAVRLEGTRMLIDYVVPVFTRPRYDPGPAVVTNLLHDHPLRGSPMAAFYEPAGGLSFDDVFQVPAIPLPVYRALERIADAITIDLKWKKNDVVMVDNTRYMHGRRGQDAQRLIYTRFGYVDL